LPLDSVIITLSLQAFRKASMVLILPVGDYRRMSCGRTSLCREQRGGEARSSLDFVVTSKIFPDSHNFI